MMSLGWLGFEGERGKSYWVRVVSNRALRTFNLLYQVENIFLYFRNLENKSEKNRFSLPNAKSGFRFYLPFLQLQRNTSMYIVLCTYQ